MCAVACVLGDYAGLSHRVQAVVLVRQPDFVMLGVATQTWSGHRVIMPGLCGVR
jgi:hypothetical protein